MRPLSKPARGAWRAVLATLAALLALSSLLLSAPAQAQQGPQDELPGALPFPSQPLGEGKFLHPDQAFRFQYGWQDPQTLGLHWEIAPRYYLYRKRLVAEGQHLALQAPPQGEWLTDEFFGESEVYRDQLRLQLRLDQSAQAAGGGDCLQLRLQWQGCADDGLCYTPQRRTLTLARPGAPEDAACLRDVGLAVADGGPGSSSPYGSSSSGGLAEDQALFARLAGGALLPSLLLFFGLGILLTFTPCVLPMVPIVSGILAGTRDLTRARSLWLTGIFVLAMSLVYAGAGAIAATTGASLQAALQAPWVLSAFALLMVALALASFGLYQLRLPARLTNLLDSLSRRQSGGGEAGVAAMGALSALIAGPCVTPPLVGALLYIAQTGDTLTGALALFAMGLGMGVPLLLVGAALGTLLPRAGAWMQLINGALGFALLGLALWFLDRIPALHQAVGYFWALLAVAALAGLTLGLHRLGRRVLPAATALAGTAALALFAVSGATLPWRPGPESAAFRPDLHASTLQQVRRQIAASDKPVILDFYADWCVECRLMEKDVFAQPQIRQLLRGWTLVRVDITANDDAARRLLREYGVIGPPTLIFAAPDGREARALRAVGFVDAQALQRRLASADSL